MRLSDHQHADQKPNFIKHLARQKTLGNLPPSLQSHWKTTKNKENPRAWRNNEARRFDRLQTSPAPSWARGTLCQSMFARLTKRGAEFARDISARRGDGTAAGDGLSAGGGATRLITFPAAPAAAAFPLFTPRARPVLLFTCIYSCVGLCWRDVFLVLLDGGMCVCVCALVRKRYVHFLFCNAWF